MEYILTQIASLPPIMIRTISTLGINLKITTFSVLSFLVASFLFYQQKYSKMVKQRYSSKHPPIFRCRLHYSQSFRSHMKCAVCMYPVRTTWLRILTVVFPGPSYAPCLSNPSAGVYNDLGKGRTRRRQLRSTSLSPRKLLRHKQHNLLRSILSERISFSSSGFVS